MANFAVKACIHVLGFETLDFPGVFVLPKLPVRLESGSKMRRLQIGVVARSTIAGGFLA